MKFCPSKSRRTVQLLVCSLWGLTFALTPCAVEAQPTPDVHPLYLRAIELRKQKDYPGALQLMEQALGAAPEDADCLALAASLFRDTGRYSVSAQYAQKAIAINPNVGWYQATWAFANYYDGNLSVARPALEHLLDLGATQVGENNFAVAQSDLDDLHDHTYTLTWNIVPASRMMKDGIITLPAPATGLPYQDATWEVQGAQSSHLAMESGMPVVRVEPQDTLAFHYIVHATVKAYSFHDLLAAAPPRAPLPDAELPADVQPFLKWANGVNNGPKIDAVAARVRADDNLTTVKNTILWLEQNMSYKREPYSNAEEAIERGSGDCGAYSYIFSALCRANGIPARPVWGVTKAGAEFAGPHQLSGHVWTEFYLPQVGWIPVDPQSLRTLGFTGTSCVLFFRGCEQPRSWSRAINREVGTYTPDYEETVG